MTPPFPGLELLTLAVLILDERLQVTYANPAAENLLAHGRKHLLGAALAKALPGNERFHARLAQAVAEESGFNEYELPLELGPQSVTVHCVAVPIREGDARLLIELREIDQHIRVAREAKFVEQQQANRELVRNLAHEIKNPLGGIRGAAQLLERELPDPELREFTQVIVKETDRLQSLMNRMLTPHRLPQVEMLNVHEVMERVRMLLLAEYPAGLTVRRDYDVSLPDLPGDMESLIQAVLNVARNAAQAMEGRGEIIFRTRVARQMTIAKTRYRHAEALEIEDNGPGIPDELESRIFFPLVTGRDGGTGLGLSLAQSYVHQHHGLIEFESAPGRTCFRILLPVRTREQAGLDER